MRNVLVLYLIGAPDASKFVKFASRTDRQTDRQCKKIRFIAILSEEEELIANGKIFGGRRQTKCQINKYFFVCHTSGGGFGYPILRVPDLTETRKYPCFFYQNIFLKGGRFLSLLGFAATFYYFLSLLKEIPPKL